MGLANDYFPSRYAPVFNSSSEAASAQDFYRHPFERTARQRGSGRCLAIWSSCHSLSSNHRYRQHRRCSYSHSPRRSGRGALVLADRYLRHCHQILRGPASHQISCEDNRRKDARRADVCPRARPARQMAGRPLRPFHGHRRLRHRQHRTSQRHRHRASRELRRDTLDRRPVCGSPRRHRHHWRREEHRTCLRLARTLHGPVLRSRLHLYPYRQLRLRMASHQTYLLFGLHSTRCRWRLCRFHPYARGPLRHRTRPVLQ